MGASPEALTSVRGVVVGEMSISCSWRPARVTSSRRWAIRSSMLWEVFGSLVHSARRVSMDGLSPEHVREIVD